MFQHVWFCLEFLVWFIIVISNAADTNCDFRQKLESGLTYYITSPNYPYNYEGKKSCRWHTTSNSRIRITCNDFNVPSSFNCTLDTFNVYLGPRLRPLRFCGNGDFSKESVGSEMVITLTTVANTIGGRFMCSFKAIEEDECRCGWKKPTKIVGGKETSINEYPMMAGVINLHIRQIYCGGTIISKKHILTAAHCLSGLTVDDLGILVGDHDLTTGTETNATILYLTSTYIVHPNYDANKKDYDIAIITIDGTITFTNEVGPACLPFQHYHDSFGGSYVDMLGWGTTEFAGALSNTLQRVRVSVTNFLNCKDSFPDLNYRQICTYAEGMDACQFDSGGPVLWQNPTTRRLISIGIISYGSFCASKQPAVNTRVGSFIDWIISETPDVKYCQVE